MAAPAAPCRPHAAAPAGVMPACMPACMPHSMPLPLLHPLLLVAGAADLPGQARAEDPHAATAARAVRRPTCRRPSGGRGASVRRPPGGGERTISCTAKGGAIAGPARLFSAVEGAAVPATTGSGGRPKGRDAHAAARRALQLPPQGLLRAPQLPHLHLQPADRARRAVLSLPQLPRQHVHLRARVQQLRLQARRVGRQARLARAALRKGFLKHSHVRPRVLARPRLLAQGFCSGVASGLCPSQLCLAGVQAAQQLFMRRVGEGRVRAVRRPRRAHPTRKAARKASCSTAVSAQSHECAAEAASGCGGVG